MVMKVKALILIFALFFVYVFPFVAIAEERRTNVIIVTEDDKIMAFSGKNKNWVPQNLKLKEKVYSKEANGNVGVVVTNERIYGFSAFIGKWQVVELLLGEAVEEVQAEGNVATVVTDQRVFGFNARTGIWDESD
jgi:hypothetical protein